MRCDPSHHGSHTRLLRTAATHCQRPAHLAPRGPYWGFYRISRPGSAFASSFVRHVSRNRVLWARSSTRVRLLTACDFGAGIDFGGLEQFWLSSATGPPRISASERRVSSDPHESRSGLLERLVLQACVCLLLTWLFPAMRAVCGRRRSALVGRHGQQRAPPVRPEVSGQ